MYSKTKDNNNDGREKMRRAFQAKPVSNQEAKSTIELEEEYEDPCAPNKTEITSPTVVRTPGLDPRFQQQDQTLRCYVMYTDFFNCEHLLGEGHEACTWFQDVYKSICPNAWIERWDEYRSENRMPWHKDGPFGKAPYGK